MGARPSLTIDAAMVRALELAARGPAHGPNPRVGAVLLGPAPRPLDSLPDAAARGPVDDASRVVLAEGFHRGAGTPHAEAAALADARGRGVDVRGATAVVTLEPCNHTGRTGPCAQALLDAGVAEVVYAVADPNPVATGGGDHLRAAGVRVATGLREAEGEHLLGPWLVAVRRGSPYVTLKLASTLDGRVAAADGTSQWITGPAARAHAHRVRAQVDAVLVGTGTVVADDPSLTARTPSPASATGEPAPGLAEHQPLRVAGGVVGPAPGLAEHQPLRVAGGVVGLGAGLAEHQPLRVVVGLRDLPPHLRLAPQGAWTTDGGGPVLHVRTHDVRAVLAELAAREVRHVLVEGGPGLATAFLAAGVVDEVHAYLAPVLLGTGLGAVGDLGVATLADAPRLLTHDVQRLGPDVLVVARVLPVVSPVPHAPAGPAADLTASDLTAPGSPVPGAPTSTHASTHRTTPEQET
ncbi:bifunctional diaminohydroxyphosphoribosylaminopyrimidine deaminase/5-amino-6-(5-phosphoribosylamino)uracil reductase RibD [Oerskovia jenensis]|uniref:Riboflavin biosynthesis protein RibD n=1 Tax=Oerskovia jenensis TaxID=162169 RepID=A0ABS2LB42_9CELL|nr:bifunctional diaminohydroxyphosphoribosylaminopyrimidine deaminase/5-amino-6-(5-phosphoribosylamino)uracil reductase RibD [Oerskovia jenensis]MBM7477318.1 diaminohydroxyphosphoribosylaminopyrimidine deaminase/5-amino-6-(5-phosphoribosylamino)uracil reductase [Oerskovia jenensis]